MGPLFGDRDTDPILNGRTDEYIADLYEAMAVHEGKVEVRSDGTQLTQEN